MKMKKGFTLVEIMIVVAIIGLLAAIAIPSFMRARLTSQKNACINNMRQIESAKDQYALEQGMTNLQEISAGVDATAFALLVSAGSPDGTTGYIKAFPTCPTRVRTNTAAGAADSYTLHGVGSNCVCRRVPGTANPPLAMEHVLQ